MEKLLRKANTGSRCGWLVGLLVATLVASVSAAPNSNRKLENKSPNAPSANETPTTARVKASLGQMPLVFEVNKGQTDAKVKYVGRAKHYAIYMMEDGTTVRINAQATVQMKLQNANTSPKVQGEDLRPSYSNYYIGNDPSKWLSHVTQYGRVRYQEVYPGIDVVYRANEREVEYDFVVKPGTDPKQIRMAYEGAQNLSINADGDLEIKTEAGVSTHRKPVVYQVVDGKQKFVDGEFILAHNTVSFKLGDYDRSQTLVIDPTLQVLSFFGGSLNDEAAGIAANATGVFFTGRTESATLPPGATKSANGISWNCFVTGLNAGTPGVPDSGGTGLLWTTYLGGFGDNACRGIAVDNTGVVNGTVYVVGYTNSGNFPIAGPATNYDAFVATLSAGGGLVNAVLYGGIGVDQGTSIALDYSTFSSQANAASVINPATDPTVVPNVVIGGLTTGNISNPKAPDGNQTSFQTCTAGTPAGSSTSCGTTDGFVAIFTKALSLLHATYVGGGGNDQVNGVAADVWGNIYATGFATPNVAPNFSVKNGIGAGNTGAPSGNKDAALATTGNGTTSGSGVTSGNGATGTGQIAVAFVQKYTCTTGSPAIGVPSPPPAIPACGGGNNLKTLGNSAMFGGSGSVINPQQTILGQQGVSEAGLGIAVDQAGLGIQAVSGNPNGSALAYSNENILGQDNIVPNTESTSNCNGSATPNTPTGTSFFVGAPNCAVSSTSTATSGGFQPGLAGPRVYVVGATANNNFSSSLTNPSCTSVPFVSSTIVPALCNTPVVTGASITAAGQQPNPTRGASLIGTVNNGTTVNSGRTQGWLVGFRFPAITQAVVQPPGATSTTTVTTLNPPTIPEEIVLQPTTCPGYTTGTGATVNTTCLQGATSGNSGIPVGNPGAPLACANPGGVTCGAPNPAFIGAWTGVTVDTAQQVYVIGQMGMSCTAGGQILVTACGGSGGPAIFGAGLAGRLALEIERIAPNGTPEPIFPDPVTQTTSSFLIDVFVPGSGSNYAQILPGAPPSPDPNQPGGLSAGISVNTLREAFFVGTTTAITATTTVQPVQATFAASLGGGAITIAPVAPGSTAACVTVAGASGCGYAPLPALPPSVNVSGLQSCTTNPTFAATVSGANGNVTIAPLTSGTGCVSASGVTVTVSAPPPPNSTNTFDLFTTTIEPALPPTPAPPAGCVLTGTALGETDCISQVGLGGFGTTNASVAPASEDVVYGAIQFYDGIAAPSVVNFTAAVNSVPSISPAKTFINYSNWEGLPLNIPPGCTITPSNGGGVFQVTQVNGTSQFQVTINPTAVNVPGVFTSIVNFTTAGPCAGVGQPVNNGAPLDEIFTPGSTAVLDPVKMTLTVTAPLNLSPQQTYVVHSPLASGLITEYINSGFQLVANQQLISNIGVTTATTTANSPINFTVQIVPGPNWIGPVAQSVVVPLPTDIIYEAPGSTQTNIPVAVNTNIIAGLPQGVYTAFILFTASPETPVTPASASVLCSSANSTVASGTTTPACIPISITVGPNVVANVPATVVFGTSTTPQQTGVTIANPVGSSGPYNFTAGYVPNNFYCSPLPAANVFFVGTGTTLVPAAVGPPPQGTIAPGGQFTLPVQINPTGLATGCYGGMILFSNNGQQSGATPQTTVPILVYVGPHTGEDTPSGNGLGLMFIPNSPFPTGGIGGCPESYTPPPNAQYPIPCPPPGAQGTGASLGAYPIIINVPSGYNPAQLADPTLITVTGLSNTASTAFVIKAPSVSGFPTGAITITNPGQSITGSSGTCTSYALFSSLPSGVGSTLGPTCSWNIWVDTTLVNSSNTTTLASCPAINGFPGTGITGTLTFAADATSFPFSSLVVPLTLCVTDFPDLNITQPIFYPNPTFGTGIPQPNFCGSSSFPVGCPQQLVGIPLPAAGIVLQQQQLNSNFACAEIGINTNGGGWTPGLGVQQVTIAPIQTFDGHPWLTTQISTAPYLGVIPAYAAPGFLTGWGFDGGFGMEGGPGALGPIIPIPQYYPSISNTSATQNVPSSDWATCVGFSSSQPCSAINTVAPYPAGPATVNNAMQTLQLCANTDPLGTAVGTFTANVMVNGAGVGTAPCPQPNNPNQVAGACIPVRFNIFSASGTGPSACALGGITCEPSQIAVFRNQASGLGVWAEAGPSNTFDASTKFRFFGLNGDQPVTGDFFGTGIVEIGVFRCPASGVCQWYIDANNNGTWDGIFGGDLIWNFGLTGDIAVVGDWNGTGTSKIGVMRCPAAGVCTWYLDIGNKHTYDPATVGTYLFGLTGDKPAVGNWAHGISDNIGVFRCPAAGVCQWIVESLGLTGLSTTNPTNVFSPSDAVFNFGLTGDQAVVGNWNNTGSKRIGVFRAASGQWFVDTNGNGVYDPGADQTFNFGIPGDIAITGFFTN